MEDATKNKTTQSFVTCVYEAKVADFSRNVTVTWSKNLTSQTLNISVENRSGENQCNCKIDLKTWQFWGSKGLKSFIIDGQRVDIFWDFRTAKFSGSPEPCSDYYVAMVSGEEVVLLLGDRKKEAFKRSKSRPSLVDSVLRHKKENVFGKRCFFTRSTLGMARKEHNIGIEASLSGPGDPELWINLDGILLFHVMNLHWRFRGNESVLVDDMPLQIFWDVHDWLYSTPNSGQGFFIFKRSTTEGELTSNPDARVLCDEESGDAFEFCHLLYACLEG
ncbi:uncharacterized protein LOC127791551 [Diospyros lotus]|uniref:uncharacterized protein LOC127791551 n=1 Tax=Diospyros lotus TaxID=55363 RepID=UPI00224EA3F1|nr:uncharacterized protein LOC127791551 [Diospyros lotus]